MDLHIVLYTPRATAWGRSTRTPRIYATSNEILKRGHVITIEPGVYIDGVGGVRIEDMVYIDGGGVVMNRFPHIP